MKVNLSSSEWKLMNRLWAHSPMTIMELTAATREETGRGKNTVITMLSRLEAKGAVGHDGNTPKGWSPLLARQDAERQETESFLSRVYGGHLGLVMSAMVDSKALTQEDIDELTAILRSAKEGN